MKKEGGIFNRAHITTSSDITDITNIFRSDKKKDYLSFLNILYTDMYYEKSNSGNITKTFIDNHKFDWNHT